MSLRRKLGPSYTEYPARTIGDYLGDKLTKLVMSAICCAVWTGAYYILIGVLNFNRKNFIEGATEMSTVDLMKQEWSLWALLGSYILITILVFRSRVGEKNLVRKRR